ncbi:hypothetical protein [Streptomyces sp. NPDC002845]
MSRLQRAGGALRHLLLVVVLVRAALARRTDRTLGLLAPGPVVRRPDPPPRGPDLTQLSVLRI